MPTSAELRTVIRVLETFQSVDPDITLPSMLAFCYIAEDDGQSGNQNKMEHRLGMSGATASRATSHWLKWKRPRVAGVDMVVSEVDPDDRRYKLLYLNHRGQAFLTKLKEAIHGVPSR